MNYEYKWGICESLGDKLQLKEKKLFLNDLILYHVKLDEGAKPNI